MLLNSVKRKMGRKALLFVLVLVVGLAFAIYVIAQINTPTVDEGISELEILETGGTGGTADTIPAAIANKSEEAEIIDPDPDRDGWIGTYDRTKLLPYVNETEIKWYKEGEIRPIVCWEEDKCSHPVGQLFIGKEPLRKGILTENDICPKNPVEFLEYGRKGSCLPFAITTCELFRIKGANVNRVSAEKSTVSSVIIPGHTWVEIEIDNKWFVIDNGWVFPLEEWIGNSVWIYNRNECPQCRY